MPYSKAASEKRISAIMEATCPCTQVLLRKFLKKGRKNGIKNHLHAAWTCLFNVMVMLLPISQSKQECRHPFPTSFVPGLFGFFTHRVEENCQYEIKKNASTLYLPASVSPPASDLTARVAPVVYLSLSSPSSPCILGERGEEGDGRREEVE